jgi:hypothetical protein
MLRPRNQFLVGMTLSYLFCIPMAMAEETGGTASTAETKQIHSFLETGYVVGGQTNSLKLADEGVEAESSYLYMETGLDYVLKHNRDRLDHRLGLVATIDLGSESDDQPGFGVGLRTRYGLSRTWALQAQAGFLMSRNGELGGSSSEGDLRFFFKEGRQLRVGLYHEKGYSLSAMWRGLDYNLKFRPSGTHSSDTIHDSGKADLFGVGIMLHGKKGVYTGVVSIIAITLFSAARAINGPAS